MINIFFKCFYDKLYYGKNNVKPNQILSELFLFKNENHSFYVTDLILYALLIINICRYLGLFKYLLLNLGDILKWGFDNSNK